eukprot:10882368-Alexandrium_andersonii.AAC.1
MELLYQTPKDDRPADEAKRQWTFRGEYTPCVDPSKLPPVEGVHLQKWGTRFGGPKGQSSKGTQQYIAVLGAPETASNCFRRIWALSSFI